MSKLKNIVDQALIKLGPEHVAAMCNCFGSRDGSWSDVPENRVDDLFLCLTRQTQSGKAVAQAKADMQIVKDSGHLTGGKEAARPNVNASGFPIPDASASASAASDGKSALSWDEIRAAAFNKMANPPKAARLGTGDAD